MRIRVGVWSVGAGCVACSAATVDRVGNNAVKPFPKALRGASCGLLIGKYLLGQLDVAFGPLRADIVAQNGLSITGSFSEANVSWDDGFEDFALEKISQIVG